MTTLAVTAIGQDRPGIVARLSQALLEAGGNIENSRMANLGGHFAVMLIVTVSAEQDAEAVRSQLQVAREDLGLEALSAEPVDELAGDAGQTPGHVLTVYGADHPGIVHAVSSVLAQHGVNICDLQTRVTSAAEPIYVMSMELALGEADPAAVSEALERVGAEAAVDVSLRALDSEAL